MLSKWGRLEISTTKVPGRYSAEAPSVLADVELRYSQVLSFGLSDDIPEAHIRNPAAIGRAMTACLWEVVRRPDFVPDSICD
jgi:hypothetical protein